MRRRNAFVMLDAMIGLILIVAIAGALGAVVTKQRKAAMVTADDRAAMRQAEAILTRLQSGESIPPGMRIQRTDSSAPAGWTWAEATGQSGSRRATVIGLVPSGGGRK